MRLDGVIPRVTRRVNERHCFLISERTLLSSLIPKAAVLLILVWVSTSIWPFTQQFNKSISTEVQKSVEGEVENWSGVGFWFGSFRSYEIQCHHEIQAFPI